MAYGIGGSSLRLGCGVWALKLDLDFSLDRLAMRSYLALAVLHLK